MRRASQSLRNCKGLSRPLRSCFRESCETHTEAPSAKAAFSSSWENSQIRHPPETRGSRDRQLLLSPHPGHSLPGRLLRTDTPLPLLAELLARQRLSRKIYRAYFWWESLRSSKNGINNGEGKSMAPGDRTLCIYGARIPGGRGGGRLRRVGQSVPASRRSRFPTRELWGVLCLCSITPWSYRAI